MKLFLLSVMLMSSLVASSFDSRYDVNMGIFGKIGYIDFSIKEQGDNYEAVVKAYTTGTAATLTGNRQESFVSKGKIKDGKYLPDTFVKTKKTDKKTRVQTYTFNHKNKKVTLLEEKTKLVRSTEFDPTSFKLKDVQKVKKSTKTKTMDNYTNDVLTAYINIRNSCKSESQKCPLVAVGAKNDENNVSVEYLGGVEKLPLKICFPSDTKEYYNLNVHPFDDEDEIVDILIAFDNDGHMKEAYLGDIFWVGEVRAKRLYRKVSSIR